MSHNDSFFQSVADGSWKTYRQGWFANTAEAAKQRAQATWAGAKTYAAQKSGQLENCNNYSAQIASLDAQMTQLNAQIQQLGAQKSQLEGRKNACIEEYQKQLDAKQQALDAERARYGPAAQLQSQPPPSQ